VITKRIRPVSQFQSREDKMTTGPLAQPASVSKGARRRRFIEHKAAHDLRDGCAGEDSLSQAARLEHSAI